MRSISKDSFIILKSPTVTTATRIITNTKAMRIITGITTAKIQIVDVMKKIATRAPKAIRVREAPRVPKGNRANAVRKAAPAR